MTETEEHRIISGDEWLPLRVREGVSDQIRMTGFKQEIADITDQVLISTRELPYDIESVAMFKFMDAFVYVSNAVFDTFIQRFAHCIEGNVVRYNNLINLCIMVKNAGDGFREVLTQNLPYVDRWTILDTGSTDNTIAIIQEVMSVKPGNLYQEPFINFRDSRNRLLDLAGTSCTFNIMLDDTYVLHGNIREFLDFARGDDVADSFSLTIEDTDTMYASNRVTKSAKRLRYVNKIHEIIEPNMNVSIPYVHGYIKDIPSIYMRERTSERKKHDIEMLMEAVVENPEDPRSYYYIADSYICLQDWENAVEWFKKRVQVGGGYKAEIQDSLYYMATISQFHLGKPWNECLDYYLRCFETDTSRAESLYFIGKHYLDEGMKNTAFLYLKKAFDLGLPDIQMSVRKNIYNFHIPKDLATICYELGEYKLGEEACIRALNDKDDTLLTNWLNIFYYINRTRLTGVKQRFCSGKLIVFVSPGGWSEWDGKVLRERGLGGSEKFTIYYAEELTRLGYTVVVFCKCLGQKLYNGVTYVPLSEYTRFVSDYTVDYAIINRYPEYIPVSCLSGAKTCYVMHDTPRENDIVVLHGNLVGLMCISEWHKSRFLEYYPGCSGHTYVISYGLDAPVYDKSDYVQKYNFIYPSFPNRGLRQLLIMWPRILDRYPRATLDIFCDFSNEWLQKHWASEIKVIQELLPIYASSVTNHGWVNSETLASFWKKSHVWFYPCTFEETCCLTAWEAAAHKTLVVSNHLAALSESIGDRGVVIEGDARTTEWHNQALDAMFTVLDNDELSNMYTDKNYAWVQTKNFKQVVLDFSLGYMNI